MEPIYVNESDAIAHRSVRTPARWPWIAVALVLLVVAVTAFYYLRRPVEKAPEVSTPPPLETPRAAVPTEPATAAPRYPLPAASAPAAAPLPALADSDGVAQDALRSLFGSSSWELWIPHDIVRRWVVTIDNLPRRKLPQDLLPVRAPAGPLRVTVGRDSESIDAENSGRYAPYVWLAQRVDAAKLVAAYVELYPLFQEQYRTLGYPKGYFNDRVIEAIDDLLATPTVNAPLALVRPRIMYEFADPDLESRSAGQKIMLRIGSANADIVKSKLREVRKELVAHSPH
ncbi:MAG TPA: DUF3014 domain-containing protein [Casimicrobiaceae bacterium]|nr:DUF3014 domain-containing protein [Casimicrobiaceae bacterium]